MSTTPLRLQLMDNEPYTGLVTSFRGYSLLTGNPVLPFELQGYPVLAHAWSPDNRAYLLKEGHLVATYHLEFFE